MATAEILLQLLTGGLLGMIGQMLRFLVGYKKLSDVASSEGKLTKDLFQTSRFVISLIIGFAAGALGVISLSEFKADTPFINGKETIMTLIGIGYAGTDFIEGFIKKFIPTDTQAQETTDTKQDVNIPRGASDQPK